MKEKPSKKASSVAADVEQTPLRWVSVEECGEILGFGRDMMSAIIEAGAPIVGRKMNPSVTQRWLVTHWKLIPKTR